MLKLTDIPNGERVSELYDIRINGIPTKASVARVSAMPFNTVWPGHQRELSQTEEAAVLSFAMSESVELEITAMRDFTEAVVRPCSDGIEPTVDGRKIGFTLDRPGQYTLELDGLHHALHIFADPIREQIVSPSDENVLYFPKGVHRIGAVLLESGQTVYIERGAVVYGAFVAIDSSDIRIIGEGIIDGSFEERTNETIVKPQDQSRRNTTSAFSRLIGAEVREPVYPVVGSVLVESRESFWKHLNDNHYLHTCIHFFGCRDCDISGVTLRDASGFTLIGADCERLVIDNVKLIGNWRYNSDGIDLFNSRDCVIRNCFLRCFDDCIVLKGIPGFDTKSMENIRVENCVVWCDWGSCLEIGAETCAPEFTGIIFSDCDCIHGTFAMMRIQSCDRAHVHGIVYENIRAEYSRHDCAPITQLGESMKFEPSSLPAELIRIYYSGENFFSNDRLKGRIYDITYRNIEIISDDGIGFPPIVLEGYSPEHPVSDVRIDRLYYNRSKITDGSVIRAGDFTDKIELL